MVWRTLLLLAIGYLLQHNPYKLEASATWNGTPYCSGQKATRYNPTTIQTRSKRQMVWRTLLLLAIGYLLQHNPYKLEASATWNGTPYCSGQKATRYNPTTIQTRSKRQMVWRTLLLLAIGYLQPPNTYTELARTRGDISKSPYRREDRWTERILPGRRESSAWFFRMSSHQSFLLRTKANTYTG